MAESLGSAVLTLLTNDRQLDEGLDRARAKVEASADNFRRVGGRMQDIGAKLSLAVTAPIAGAGAAILANAKAIANTVPEIENFARLANTGTDNFQRLAFASKSVGIEGDKLGDIYKDVNDKMGEFLATGGGEMKDFFKNIAPQVGVTAQAFRNLSGPDALQLYYTSLQKAGLSQQQITFYMESIADEATALGPLLRDNGKAFDELGKKASVITPQQIADFKAYNAAQLQMEQATQKLTIAIVSSGLLEGITSLVTKAADFTTELSKTNPELLQTSIAVAGMAAAIGPVVIGLGSLTSGFGGLLRMLAAGSGLRVGLAAISVALGGPVGVAILAAAVVAAFANWEKIGPWIDNVSTRMADFQTKFDASAKQFQSDIDAIDQRLGLPTKDEMFRFIERNFTESVARIDAWLASVQRAAASFDAAMVQIATSAVASAQRLYTGVKSWLQDQLNGVFEFVRGRIQSVGDKFYWLWDVVVGHSYVPDMVDEIGRQMARLDAEMVSPTTAATSKTAQAFQALQQRIAPMLERLFPDQARFNQFRADLDDLAAYAKAKGWSAEQTETARQGLSNEFYGTRPISERMDGIIPEVKLPDLDLIPMKMPEIPEEVEEDWREGFRRSMSSGMLAALDGNLSGFLANWLANGAARGLEMAFDAVADVLGNLLSGLGGGGGGIGSILSSLFAGGFATGGLIPSGKFGIVGERGPELAIASPSGALIRPNASLSNMALQPGGSSPSVSIPISIDATGADPAALGRVRDELRTLRAELPSQIVKTVQDAGERRIINPGTWR